jgi:hypothetical protein
MSLTFDEYVAAGGIDEETLEHAARYYLAERTDDLSTREMRDELVEGVGDEQALDEALALLEDDPTALAAASREILAAAWERSDERDRVRAALAEARTKLPVVEIGILAIAAMYGMWLLATGGVKRNVERTVRSADGSETKERETVYYPPDGPLRAVVDVFRRGGSS